MTQKELLQAYDSLPPEAQRQVLNFIAFLRQNYQIPDTNTSDISLEQEESPPSGKFSPRSAEARAISRLSDQDDPTKWITSMEENEPIDELALSAWLQAKGYQ